MFQTLEARTFLSAVVDGRIIRIEGTAGNDIIHVTKDGGTTSSRYSGTMDSGALIVTINGISTRIPLESGGSRPRYDHLLIHAGHGHDRVEVADNIWLSAAIYGSNGNDTLVGGRGHDRLNGGG